MKISPFSAQDFAAISTLGLEFAVAVALGVGAGYWADVRYQTSPWLTVLGVLAGFALGMYIVVRQAQRMSQTTLPEKKQ